MEKWQSIHKGQRVELGFLQVDIAHVRASFHRHMMEIAAAHGGPSRGGDGGVFMFLTAEGEGFNALAFSALGSLNTRKVQRASKKD